MFRNVPPDVAFGVVPSWSDPSSPRSYSVLLVSHTSYVVVTPADPLNQRSPVPRSVLTSQKPGS